MTGNLSTITFRGGGGITLPGITMSLGGIRGGGAGGFSRTINVDGVGGRGGFWRSKSGET